MNDRLRILFVSPRLPQPLNSGTNIRIRHLVEALTEAGDVHWLGYGSGGEMKEFEQEAQQDKPWWVDCVSMRATPRPKWVALNEPVFDSLMRRKAFASAPQFFATFPVEPLRSMAARMAQEVDLVWVERLYTAHNLHLPAEKCIVDIDDLESIKIARRADLARGWYSRWAMRREATRLTAAEAAAPRRYARVAVCSEIDAARWPNEPDRVWVVPNGADDALFERPRPPKQANRIVFVGTLGYGPNSDAINWFAEEIFPRVIEGFPEVSLAIVGRAPPPHIQRLHDGSRVTVHADVPDVAPHVQEAALSIVPLRVGGGTRLKILESLALGTPVVSTTIGAEGLDLRHNTDLLLADSPASFADAVLRLLRNPDDARCLTEQGNARVSEIYRWSSIRHRLAAQVGTLAASLRTAARVATR